jgi:hypothetical protein
MQTPKLIDPSCFGFLPICSVKILANAIGVTPQAVLARFKSGNFPPEALLRVGGRSVAVDLQVLLSSLREKQATLLEDSVAVPGHASEQR